MNVATPEQVVNAVVNLQGANPERLEAAIIEARTLPQVDMPLKHEFAPGVYLRTIFMPKGTFVIGARHRTEHFNIVTAGSAKVIMDGEVIEIKAPCTFVSRGGLRKILHIIEDMTWSCVFPLAGLEHCGNDVEKLENELVDDAEHILERRKMREVSNGCS